MTDATETVEYTSETTTEDPTLGLQDITNALKIIDFACEQGAFKGWNTIEQVRAVRAKIAAFLDFAEANSAPPVAEAPAEEEAAA
jgi:hypothetical protein